MLFLFNVCLILWNTWVCIMWFVAEVMKTVYFRYKDLYAFFSALRLSPDLIRIRTSILKKKFVLLLFEKCLTEMFL